MTDSSSTKDVGNNATPTFEGKVQVRAGSDDAADDSASTIIVDWEGPEDIENPKNWAYRKKWIATVMVALFTFISPTSSSMIAPASENVALEFGVTNSVVIAMFTSSFILAYALGPFILGPMSEIYGRSRVIQGANAFYLVWNFACAYCHTATQLIVCRFFAGLGGSAPITAGASALGDIWRPEQRGRAMAIYSLPVLVGPSVGPVIGAWIAEKTTWKWVFWSTSIFTVVVQLFGLVLLQESYEPTLLQRKATRLNKSVDPEKHTGRHFRSKYDNEDRRWRKIYSRALTRPVALFFKEPIAITIGVYMALVYGIFYLFLTTLPLIFRDVYHQTTGIAGLNYLAMGIGLIIASQVNARWMDRIYMYFKNKNDGIGLPEFRVPSMFPGSIVLPIGLLLTGWGAERHVHWAVTDLGLVFVGGGVILNFQSLQTYVLDCYTLYSASALSAVSALRAVAGFAFPLFASRMYETLGYGRGMTVLAAFAIAFGGPAPILFWIYGRKIRMMSRYCRKD